MLPALVALWPVFAFFAVVLVAVALYERHARRREFRRVYEWRVVQSICLPKGHGGTESRRAS